MSGKTDLKALLKGMMPVLHEGKYVYSTAPALSSIPLADVVGFFREDEAVTLIVSKDAADRLGLRYEYVAAWITLTVGRPYKFYLPACPLQSHYVHVCMSASASSSSRQADMGFTSSHPACLAVIGTFDAQFQ